MQILILLSADTDRHAAAVGQVATQAIWDNSVATLITVVGTLLPWLLLFGLIWFVVRRLARRAPTPAGKPD